MKIWIVLEENPDATEPEVSDIFCKLDIHEYDDIAQILEADNPKHAKDLRKVRKMCENDEAFMIDFYMDK